jgi:hypothetical protein
MVMIIPHEKFLMNLPAGAGRVENRSHCGFQTPQRIMLGRLGRRSYDAQLNSSSLARFSFKAG